MNRSALLSFVALLTCSQPAFAYINQIDGTVVPTNPGAQPCLDGATAEGGPGLIDQQVDAAILPEAYRPVLDIVSGRYRVTFVDIAEGAGFRNSFGYFWVGEDVSDTNNLHTIFGCRTYGSCGCPCSTTRTITVDFDLEPGFSVGRPIGLWLRTPERLDDTREDGTFPSGCPFDLGCVPTGSNVNDSCGGVLDTNNRIYFTSQALNDDGDFVHFLVWESVTRTNTFYFGFEDLFRGGDNDFEDFLARATGLVPLCVPTSETCDNTDEDCDGAVDEAITRPCATACGPGIETCSMGSFGTCSSPVPAPTETVCDNMDEDCDGFIDEGLTRPCSNMCGTGIEICTAGMFADCSAPTPRFETCDNTDEDCDTLIDENLTRSCSTLCGGGLETCTAGTFGMCTAPVPNPIETCDNTDEDCDGLTDEGLSRACMTACGVGTEVCISGSFVGCTAPTGGTETCNNIDDDCDGTIDEGLSRACSSACGVGTEVCMAGVYVGCDAPLPAVEICNNIDDDCNGIIDDGNPGGGATCLPDGDGGFAITDGGVPMPDGGAGVCLVGRIVCLAGELTCRGASSTTREVCNCEDDDCDGLIDEDVDGTLCPGGACIDCTCVDECEDDEFPCPPGRECDRTLADPGMGIVGYCVPGMCADVMCTDEEQCNASNGLCENLCDGVTCPDGFACSRGTCFEDTCYGLGCPMGERCRMSTCEPDPCLDVTCAGDTYCLEGSCTAVCDIVCPGTEGCTNGVCAAVECGGTCTADQSCVAGACVDDDCTPVCGRGRICRGTECVDDLCRGVRCPDGSICRADGQCVSESIVPPAERDYGLAAGGCFCHAAGSSTGNSAGNSSPAGPLGFGFLLLLIGVRRSRRRRRRGHRRARRSARLPGSSKAGQRAVLVVAGLAMFNVGCDVDPFCFSGCEDGVDAGPTPDAGRPDARAEDGCVNTGDEMCNESDDDCDGLVDEDFDTDTDPRNCGACGAECVLPFAFPGCAAASCIVDRCEIGHHDLNDTPADGCEYECPPSGDELCDTRDNDCDGVSDEGFELTTDLANCGMCGNACAFANAGASCVGSGCVMGACNTGFVDLDGDPLTGCEYRCTPTGTEMCNGVDDDCNGSIDEGFDLTTDPANCGVCGVMCNFANAVGLCTASVCGIGSCAMGFRDIDGDPATGCEYPCTPTGGADDCDGVDDDCDGAFDEADTVVGTACGVATGDCTEGTNSCQLGGIVCVGGAGPLPETCDGFDEDCDTRVDESTVAEPIPGLGDRCGATNVGRCEFGAVQCTGGGLSCGGAFVGPIAETCNGNDDDCNGATDDGVVAPPLGTIPTCADVDGVCAGRTPFCLGLPGWECSFPATYQAIETICDTLDNDCDATPDENCIAPAGGSDVRLDDGATASSSNSLTPTILAGSSGNEIWVSFMDLRNGAARIYYNRSANSGGTWVGDSRLDTSGGAAFEPRIAEALPSDLAVLWSDFRGGSNFREIYSRQSDDLGVTFDASDDRVNPTGPTSTQDSFNVEVASSGPNIYVTFEAFITNRSRHVYFSRSTDSGETWSTPVQVSSGVGATYVAATPVIAAFGSNVFVAWRDNRNGSLDIYLRRSNDSGATFAGGDVRIDLGDAAGSNSSFSPAIATRGWNVYVVWVDDRDMGSFDIWANRSQDSGTTWLPAALQLDQDAFAHDSLEPHIVAPSAGLALVGWADFRSGFPDPMVTRTDDAGDSWSVPVRVDTSTNPGASASLDVSLGADGSLIVAAWADDRAGLLDIYANFSLDGGLNWQPQDYRLSTSALGTSDSQRPRVDVTPGRAHVVWEDHRLGGGCPAGASSGMSCANGDIFYRRMQ